MKHLNSFKIEGIFYNVYIFKAAQRGWVCVHVWVEARTEEEGEKESQAGSKPSAEPGWGLSLKTLISWPQPKKRVGGSPDWLNHLGAPRFFFFLIYSITVFLNQICMLYTVNSQKAINTCLLLGSILKKNVFPVCNLHNGHVGKYFVRW